MHVCDVVNVAFVALFRAHEVKRFDPVAREGVTPPPLEDPNHEATCEWWSTLGSQLVSAVLYQYHGAVF